MDKEDEEEEILPEMEGRINIEKASFTPTTTISTTEFQTDDECHLPYFPAVDPDLENAWRFGTFAYLNLTETLNIR